MKKHFHAQFITFLKTLSAAILVDFATYLASPETFSTVTKATLVMIVARQLIAVLAVFISKEK